MECQIIQEELKLICEIWQKELAPEIILDFVTDFPGVAYEEELRGYGSRIYYIGAKSQGLLNSGSNLESC